MFIMPKKCWRPEVQLSIQSAFLSDHSSQKPESNFLVFMWQRKEANYRVFVLETKEGLAK